jgi:hypothetical protein
MSPDSVRRQIADLTSRLLIASISVKQFQPTIRTVEGGAIEIGGRQRTTIAMRDIPYEDIYRELDSHDAYHVKLVDGGLLLFQYSFRPDRSLAQHRLAYFPSPVLPTVEEAPALYEQDEMYGDITARRLVRFPVRFDYAPDQKVDVLHPASHMTLGQYESCRIPVAGPLGPSSGSVAAGGLKNLNDCFQSDPAVDARPRRFPIELAAPGPQAATEFSWFAVGNRPKSFPSPIDGITITPMPARAPSLWEMQGATVGEDDPQAQSAPEHEFDQRVAW